MKFGMKISRLGVSIITAIFSGGAAATGLVVQYDVGKDKVEALKQDKLQQENAKKEMENKRGDMKEVFDKNLEKSTKVNSTR